MTFVPLPKARRKVTKPKTIVDNLKRLSDWYAVNKPGLRSMTISQDDAYSLRQLWKRRMPRPMVRQSCALKASASATAGRLRGSRSI